MSLSVDGSSSPSSCPLARGLSAGTGACSDVSSDESVPGAGNMWSPLLCAAYHYDIGEYLAKSMCSRSAAALSQSCHFAVLVNPIERASMDRFFHMLDAAPVCVHAASTACSSSDE